jgi:Txe/YoeB family toxin of Txe-Axe toxin-antitoxin module
VRRVSFYPEAWDDYLNLEKNTKKKVDNLIRDTQRNGSGGIGHPEPLLEANQGYFLRKLIKETDLFLLLMRIVCT